MTIGKYAGTTSIQSAPTKDNVYENILKDVAQLTKLGVPRPDIKIVINPDTETNLLLDPKYANATSEIGSTLARTGTYKRITGAESYVSYLMEDVNYIVFYPEATLKFDWYKTPLELVKIQDQFMMDAYKLGCRFTIGHALLNPELLIFNNK